MDDPFLGEWEQIHAYVCARPMASAGEILREWQRRFPERFVEAHLSMLQRRLREMRASLVASPVEPSGGQTDDATASRASSEPPSTRETLSLGADEVAVIGSGPEAAPSVLPPTPEEEMRPAHQPQASASETSSIKDEGKEQDDLTVQAPPVVGSVHALLPATMTIDHAIRLFLQEEHTHDWEPKTREWHETSLGQLQRYAAWRKMLLLSSLTPHEIQGWLTFLRTEALVTGAFRAQSTISTYARSALAMATCL